MMSEAQIIERLEQMGYKGPQIRTTLRDVGQIVLERAVAAYVSRMPEVEQERIGSFSPEEFEQYFAEHKEALAPFTEADFGTIHDSTWEDYFNAAV